MSAGPTVRVLAADVDRFRGSRAGLVRLLRDCAPDVALLHRVPTHPLSGHRLGALASDVGLVVVGGGRAAAGSAGPRTDREAPVADDRTARLVASLRDGWHGLGGGDAASCPGCPVCALGDQVARLDPSTTEHLQSALGHLAAAGRDLLAVLGPRTQDPAGGGDAAPEVREVLPEDRAAHDGHVPRPGRAPHEQHDDHGTTRSRRHGAPDHPAPQGEPVLAWTRIPVTTGTDEEHP